jgi:hypothetical protein
MSSAATDGVHQADSCSQPGNVKALKDSKNDLRMALRGVPCSFARILASSLAASYEQALRCFSLLLKVAVFTSGLTCRNVRVFNCNQ